MMKMRAAGAITACLLISACATQRPEAPREVVSAKAAEAVRDCIVQRLATGRPEGLPAPEVRTTPRVNGFLIAFPPLNHTGITVTREEGGSSRVVWTAVEAEPFGDTPDIIRACAAG